MVNLNSVEGIESLIEKKTKPLDKQIKELTNLVNKLKESISATRSCTELNTYFKKGDKVIACNKLEGTVVSSDTQTMVKVNIKGTTIGINARSLELKSI
jgi:hypothetical protein